MSHSLFCPFQVLCMTILGYKSLYRLPLDYDPGKGAGPFLELPGAHTGAPDDGTRDSCHHALGPQVAVQRL